MPSKSDKQKRFMEIASHSPEFAAKAGIDPEVAKEFHEADKKAEPKTSRKDTKKKMKD